MKQIEIGKSGIKTSAVHLGAFAIGGGVLWGDSDEQEAIRTIHAALDAGINAIDTAPIYNFGNSERIVGKALRSVPRDRVVISTKCGLRWDNGEGTHFSSRDGHEIYRNLSPASIRYEVEQSLQRLGTDYIDIYITHWQSIPPFVVPIAETMGTLMELKKEGKIRAVGISNITPEQVEEYMRWGQVDLMQEKYNVLCHNVEARLLPMCNEHKITLQCYAPLEQGLLTGRFGRDYKPEHDIAAHRKRQALMQDQNRNLVLDLLEGWDDLCRKYQCSYSNLAVAWLTAQSEQVAVICGARKPEQILDNAKGGALVLEAADAARMRAEADAVIARLQK